MDMVRVCRQGPCARSFIPHVGTPRRDQVHGSISLRTLVLQMLRCCKKSSEGLWLPLAPGLTTSFLLPSCASAIMILPATMLSPEISKCRCHVLQCPLMGTEWASFLCTASGILLQQWAKTLKGRDLSSHCKLLFLEDS